MKVVIGLAAYNGAAYIREQIDSIIGQTFADWRLLIRDDGSSDGTPELIAQAAKSDPRIGLVQDGRGNLGPIGNFAALLEAASEQGADYVFLADQDDVWLPEKIDEQIACMRAAEARYGRLPLLVHSDLTVVDASLRTIHPSFMKYQRISHRERNPIKALLAQNFVTGCTAVVNRPLLDVALPVPNGIIMHDWWLALCAAMYGRIAHVAKATVLYRQHGRNQVGAKGYWARYLSKARAWLRPHKGTSRWRLGIVDEVRQASVLLSRVQERSQGVDRRALLRLQHYAAILDERAGGFRRMGLLFMSGVHPQTALSTLDFYRRLVYAG